MTRTSSQILAEIQSLQDHRLSKEMSDDFAYSNGTLSRIDSKIAALRRELHDVSGRTCRTNTFDGGPHVG